VAGTTVDRLIISIAAITIALGAVVWVRIVRRIRSGQAIVPFIPRRAVPWRFGDLLLVAMFYVLANTAFVIIANQLASITAGDRESNWWQLPTHDEMTGTDLMVMTGAGIATNLLAAGFALWWIFWHTNANAQDFGWRRETIGADVRLGLWTFAAVALPIYGLQALLAPLTDEKHPIIEVLSRESTPLLIVICGISAVIVAPFAEEFFFRVLLQGWLESWGTAAAGTAADATEPVDHRPWGGAIPTASLIFALLHIGHGTAPIPLFFLALALGYLYQRTHRLLPCATVHFCLNAFSYAELCLSQAK
jgi:membrane protease YdiL (CAAX protease family)